MATSASCSGVGSGITPQSANTSAPPAPTAVSGKTMRKQPDTLVTPLAGPMPWRAARTVAAVVAAQPATQPSASPAATISEANSSGLATAVRAALVGQVAAAADVEVALGEGVAALGDEVGLAQDRLGQPFTDQDPGRLPHPRVVDLGQDDPLRVGPGPVPDAGEDGVGGRSRGSAGFAWAPRCR